jgi:magnesium-transporting ATPase (P-type)
MHETGLRDFAKVASLCNDASITYTDGKFTRVGEPTEAALSVLVEKLGVPGLPRSSDPVIIASECSGWWHAQYTRVVTLEFSRDRKSMSVLSRPLDPKDGGKNRLFVKGAPEMLLPRCTKVSSHSPPCASVCTLIFSF